MTNKPKVEELINKEEWGGWKIVADMLDHPYGNGLYPTSKCYLELYNFVVSQKKEATQRAREESKNEIRKNVGMLRQWLNEDRITDKKMVTNEDLELFLFGQSPPTPPLKEKGK